jgi:hypothetical protein
MNNKINVYINSKNRDTNETTSQFKVKIPDNLLRLKPNEYFTLNVNGFYCFNSWFNCLDSFNNMFEIYIYNVDGALSEKYEYRLKTGNPTVIDIKNDLNLLLVNKVFISYDKIKNKFIFERVLSIDDNNYTMYLNIINCEDFLGFFKSDRNKKILLPVHEEIYSYSVINVNGDEAIIIKLSGDCIFDGSTIDNFGTTIYEPSNIIFMKPIDVASGGLLKYNNEDGRDSFQYKLSNVEQINWFTLMVYNQDNEHIPEFSDYILLLQFIKHQRDNKTDNILQMILDYIKQIYMLLTHVIFPATN